MVCIWVSAAPMLAAGLYIFPFRVKQQYNERCLQMVSSFAQSFSISQRTEEHSLDLRRSFKDTQLPDTESLRVDTISTSGRLDVT
jgi:hypothetical protein